MALVFRPVNGRFGIEIIGLDPGLDVDDGTFRRIKAAWAEGSFLVFRDLEMTPGQQVDFSRRFGPLHIMPGPFNLEGVPEIFVVSNAEQDGKPIGARDVGMGFHTDGEDTPLPFSGSLLYALQVPPAGGDTLFADMYAAYENLPRDVKRRIGGRRARYSRRSLYGLRYPDRKPPTADELLQMPEDVYHPLARLHPDSGRTALYIGHWACDVEGLPEEEGRELISHLQDFARQPRFVYRHVWRKRDAVLWDNRCMQHCATGFDTDRYVRLMHRTTLQGGKPVMATDPPA